MSYVLSPLGREALLLMEPGEIDEDAQVYGGLVVDALRYAWGVGDATPDDLVRRFDLNRVDAESIIEFVRRLTPAESHELSQRLYEAYDAKGRYGSIHVPQRSTNAR